MLWSLERYSGRTELVTGGGGQNNCKTCGHSVPRICYTGELPFPATIFRLSQERMWPAQGHPENFHGRVGIWACVLVQHFNRYTILAQKGTNIHLPASGRGPPPAAGGSIAERVGRVHHRIPCGSHRAQALWRRWFQSADLSAQAGKWWQQLSKASWAAERGVTDYVHSQMQWKKQGLLFG